MHSSYAATNMEPRAKTTSLSFVGVTGESERRGKNNHQEVEIEHLERVPYSSSTLDIHTNPGLVIITIK